MFLHWTDITQFHNIGNSGKFIPKSSLFLGGNVELKLSNMLKILESFGVNKSTVKSLGFEGRRRSVDNTEISVGEIKITNENQLFEDIKKASTDIYNCLTSTSYLSNKLNKIDKDYFKEYLDFPKVGPVNDIRKEVATYLVENNITPAILEEIIRRNKTEKPNQLRAWLNPYKILHPFINQEYKHFDEKIEKFTKEISNTLGVKYKINNFNGSQQQGSEKYWIAFYNKDLENQSKSLQLFINFERGGCNYGIYKHNGSEYLVGPESYTTWENFNNFISENIHYILEDNKSNKSSTTDISSVLDDYEITKVYCVRGGRGNSDANLFLQGNFVAIGYNTRGFDIGSKTKEEIAQFLLMNYENSKTSIPQYIQQIELFKKIKIGDIILVPDNEGTNVGKVVSGVYLVDDEHYPNRINVEWLEERVGRNKSLNLPKSVFEVKNFDTEIMNFTGTEEESDELEIFNRFAGIPQPFDIESELGKAQAQAQADSDIENFSRFRAVQNEEEDVYSINPFRQSICVLGKSGAGKSFTIDDILDNSEHEYEFIIPSASTTGLLSQFSPSAKDGRGGYIPSRLGKLIEKAYKNKGRLYTAVFDECHKSNIIEMINDELLQAISTERNKNRFISLDDETSDLYPSKVLDKRGNIQITDNLGFIFISSNARVISGNEDFFNRVDLVEITKADRDLVKTIKDLDNKRVKDTDEKYELVSKIMNETKR
jgi:5-methylcytosine-specific restriction protein B